MASDISSRIQKNIPLAQFTTIQLGGNASEYISCTSTQDIVDALEYAKQHDLRVHILGGGSNTIFSDTGFTGLIIHIQTTGISEQQDGNSVLVTVQAGEAWDTVVQYAIKHNLAGIECLSGIPGSCGGTPFQNVGAYGQEVAETITTVFAIERTTGKSVEFSNADCRFGYRTSRFKTTDNNNYIITSVVFRLMKNGAPAMKYAELAAFVKTMAGQASLSTVREAVLVLRKKKSMVVDINDPNSISCGSFFTNPIILKTDFENNKTLKNSDIPVFPAGNDTVKLSAGWLIEHSGFQKGQRAGNVGISQNHSLALINHGGTTQELLAFAKEMQKKVLQEFRIKLEMEPIVV